MGLRTGLTSAAYEEDLGVMMKKAGLRIGWFDVCRGKYHENNEAKSTSLQICSKKIGSQV
jgi:hypothetical protein